MTDVAARRILAQVRTIAVLGAHNEPTKPACYVPEYLHGQGYRILPVNPQLVGEELWGEPVRATLLDLEEPVDLVDIFRRPEHLMAHLPDILAMVPAPAVVWLQLGIRHDVFAKRLEAEGIEVIQSRCTLADHRRFGLGRVS